jgi:hypothetical protein
MRTYRHAIQALALGTLTVLALFAVDGCSQEAEETPEDSEDQLVGFKGNVDHASVVEATTIMLTTTSNPLLDTNLDSYNREDPFEIKTAVYRETFAKNLLKFDAIDGKTDWTPEQSAKWIARMSSSYIVVDTSKPCDFADPHTYLEIERAQLTGTAHTTCGGRMPNEDGLDVTMNFLARGPSATLGGADAIADGVDQATQKSSATFPYLADLNE